MRSKDKKRVPANAVHPGEVLREEFMAPLNLTAAELARRLQIPVPRVNDIARERRELRPTRRCAWPGTLAIRRTSGWDCRPSTS